MAGKVVGGGVVFLYSLVVARVLGATLFGLFMLGMTIITFSGFICRLGLDAGVVKFTSVYLGVNDKRRVKGTIVSALLIALVASLLMILALFFLSDTIFAFGFGKPELSEVVKWLSIALPFFSVMYISLGFTQGYKRMRYFVYCHNLSLPIANLVLAILFLYLGLGLYGVISAQILSVAAVSIFSLSFIRKCFPEICNIEPKYENWQLLRISIPLSLVLFLNFIATWTDTLMLGYFKATRDVGIYNAAMKTASLFSLILVSFNSIFAPFVSDLHNRGEIKKLENLYNIITRWIFTVGLGALLFFVSQSRQILFLFGPDFDEGAFCLIILSIAQFVNAGLGSAGLILAMTGWQKLLMFAVFFTCIVNICLNYLLIQPYGITGAAIATGTSTVLLNVGMLYPMNRIIGVHPSRFKLLRSILSGILTYVFIYAFNQFIPIYSAKTGLLGQATLFASLYAGLLLILGIHEEDKFIVEMVRQKLRKG